MREYERAREIGRIASGYEEQNVQVVLKNNLKSILGFLVEVTGRYIVLRSPVVCNSCLFNTGILNDNELSDPQLQFQIEPLFPFSHKDSDYELLVDLEDILGIAPIESSVRNK